MIQFIDISKTVQYDEAVQQKQFASMLNATVSHEMRGPISSMTQNIERQSKELKEIQKDFSSFKQDLKEIKKSCTPSQKEYVKKMSKFTERNQERIMVMNTQKDNIVTGAKLLGFYVQDMLDLAQIRSGKIVKNIERVDINEVLREILSTQDIMAHHKNVQLILLEFEDQDKMVDIDPQRLQQVSLNLLTNAMKFSK